MASHFSSIGMPVGTQEDFIALAQKVAAGAEPVEAGGQGRYLRWRSQSGAELWLQLDSDGALIGMNPHFFGHARLKVGLTAAVERKEETKLDGAFHGWADPQENLPEHGAYPLVFDCPDFARVRRAPLPAVVQAQVAAFAHELRVFPTVEFYDGTDAGEVKFASQSFVPVGLFSPEGGKRSEPGAFAIFTGHVVDAEIRVNELTSRAFQWISVDTYGGRFDVVADPDILSASPVPGGVVSGTFWLSGRFAEASGRS